MMSGFLSDEAIELMVASLFVRPGAYRSPVTPHVGFLRFLRLIHTFDWLGEPLIVDIPGEILRFSLLI